mmetsp:Transcript_28812/g.47664  ORF Transcript_28812/g.47664 Transcript_28812/m.47664 type:complete len:207 (-) Transcript_28812:319-939(-)
MSNYQKPSYHWEGFGRKSTKPPWFNQVELDPGRKPVEQWEGETCGVPRVQKKELSGRLPPGYNTRSDQIRRLMEPDASTHRLAGQNVMRGTEKSLTASYSESSLHSRKQMQANREAAMTSELSNTLYGRSRPLSKPVLYPTNVDHAMALVLEKKVGPRPAWDQRPPPPSSAAARPYQWDQTQFMPFSRTRKDFSHLKQIRQPQQPL